MFRYSFYIFLLKMFFIIWKSLWVFFLILKWKNSQVFFFNSEVYAKGWEKKIYLQKSK